jgi:SAM-dependent methyltransferase
MVESGPPVATPVYDRIGLAYARRRQPDPRIAAQIIDALGDAETVVDVGAGTGSYEPHDRRVVAVEPSTVMIAQRPPGSAPVVRAWAEALPFRNDTFDAALAILTVHHWPDKERGLAELVRVAARRIVFTFDPDVHYSFSLLDEYFPAAMEHERDRVPAVDDVARAIGATRVEVIPVPHDCTDGFGWAYWRRPEAYLDPEVRACISMFARLDPADVEPGVERLRRDLESGEWYERHADLLDKEWVDGGYRLVIA